MIMTRENVDELIEKLGKGLDATAEQFGRGRKAS
jgi:hypothetical protein